MAKRIVKHPKLYMRVGGKVQHLAVGTEVDLSEEQIKKLGKKVGTKSTKPTVKADSKGSTAGASASVEA